MSTISLDPEAIEQLSGERKGLLDAIDSLRKHGVGRLVDLPQIIVVGDQSSGKSSVLEAISRVRFPVKDGLCTRFATELVLRTDPKTRVEVRVQPATVSAKVSYTFKEAGFDKEDLPRIIEEAKAQMIKDSKAFSEDVLRIEISSPDVPHLTLVDLPGFYHSEDENQDADGRKIVDRLVEGYMARKNSIILAVVSARNQLILQKVLSKVKGHDKKQQRTLGIITKPDLLTQGSQDEDRFLKLARNHEKSYQLVLGWHVLRNRGETEAGLTAEERDQKEAEFFDSSIWSAISSNNRGVGTLRKKLSNILLDHIRNNLDTLIKDIEDNMNIRQSKLRRLGDSRSSPREIRAHLDKLASQFQILSLHAVEGNYADEFFGDLYPEDLSPTDESRVKKIRALVRDLNRTFTYVLATKGSRRIITAKKKGIMGIGGDATDSKAKLPYFLQVLEKQYAFVEPKEVTRDAIAAELEPLSAANQGNEFPGTTNDRLAVKLFQDQSRPWEPIARFHIDLLLSVAKSFAEKLVAHITGPDQKTCSAILSTIIDPFFEKRKLMLDAKLQELLYHFRSGYPQPLDAEFRAALSKRHQNHLTVEMVQSLLANRPELFTQGGVAELTGLVSSARESEFGVDSLIDKSETYYELSLRTFTDNVVILAIENCLIKDLPTILTTSTVSQMEDEELKGLAAESEETQVERAELQSEYDALKKGLDICKSYRLRNRTVLPTGLSEVIQRSSEPTTSGPPSSTTATTASGGAAIAPSTTPSNRDWSIRVLKPATSVGGGSLTPSTNAATVTASSLFGSTTPSRPLGGLDTPSNGAAASARAPSSSVFGTSAPVAPVKTPSSSVFGASASAASVKNPSSSVFGTSAPTSSPAPAGGSASSLFGSGRVGSSGSSTPVARTLFGTAVTSPPANGTTSTSLFGAPVVQQR
ncbi:P-loop containing nucleoside triphosphate hydrolase protein [Poronia punctata]|nr:P-loop containing nucleoside triphosphate hydrolase protein [Poronia punctata]